MLNLSFPNAIASDLVNLEHIDSPRKLFFLHDDHIDELYDHLQEGYHWHHNYTDTKCMKPAFYI